MARATCFDRQETQHLRRLVRRSMDLPLDDDIVVPEESWAAPSFVAETALERDIQDWFGMLADDDSRDQ